MKLNTSLINVPGILKPQEIAGWEQFRDKHGIGKDVQIPSVWATVGAPATEADRTLIFFGHYDVVSINKESWRLPAFTFSQDEINANGRGVMDMKGGMAAQLAAIEAFMQQATLPPRTRLAFLATPLEEKSGHFGGKAVLDYLVKKDEINPDRDNFVIVGEPTGLNVLTIRRGSYMFETDVFIPKPDTSDTHAAVFRGRTGHAGNFNIFKFRQGAQAHPLYEMARAYKEGKLEGNPIWFEAGVASSSGIIRNLFNVIPDIGILFMASERKNPELVKVLEFLYQISSHSDWREDLPTTRGISLNSYFRHQESDMYTLGNTLRILTDNTEMIKNLFREAAIKARLLTGGLIVGHPKFNQRDSELSKIAGEVVEAVTGRYPDIRYMGNGCSDGQYAAAHGLEVVEIGPIGENEHRANESVNIPSLVHTANIYLELIKCLLVNQKHLD